MGDKICKLNDFSLAYNDLLLVTSHVHDGDIYFMYYEHYGYSINVKLLYMNSDDMYTEYVIVPNQYLAFWYMVSKYILVETPDLCIVPESGEECEDGKYGSLRYNSKRNNTIKYISRVEKKLNYLGTNIGSNGKRRNA